MRRIHPHRLQYQDDYTPYSGVYDDVFFLAQKGISESTYVYLEGARVAEGIRLGQAKIRIAEIGFGVGLNFLLTLRCFLENSKDHQTLYYFSVEKHPVLKDSLKELYSRYPELKREAELLLENYPHLTPGFHHISLLNGRVILFLMFGDAHELLSRLELSKENLIQHWYWDGFSPSKNADAFSEKIFEQVARLSNTGAIGASFTAAGWVRRNLEDIGYVIQKRPGFGHKRECIQAIFSSRPSSSVTSLLPPWFSEEKLNRLKKGDRIAVLGAGLAGSAIASALASRGYEVDVYDPNGIANGASGNKAGLFNAQLSKLPNPISRFSQLALVHFLRELKRIDIPAHFGIFRQGKDEMTALTNSEYPENFFEEKDGGVLLPECGFIQPHTLCKKRLDHPKIRLHHLAINTVKKNTDGKFELFQETKKNR